MHASTLNTKAPTSNFVPLVEVPMKNVNIANIDGKDFEFLWFQETLNEEEDEEEKESYGVFQERNFFVLNFMLCLILKISKLFSTYILYMKSL